MSGTLRIVADDLTGALDSAAAFAGSGPDAGVPVGLGRPPADAAPVLALCTGTRDVDRRTLPAALAPAWAWLAGADLAFKKVDSLLRGNSFAEVALAARSGAWQRVVFAPAFPAQGRCTLQGRLVVQGRAQGPVIDDALADAGFPAGVGLAVPDVESEADLLALVRRPQAGRTLWCGSAGLAQALAAARGAPVPASDPVPAGAGAQPLLLVSASHQAVTRRQWAALRACHPGALVAEAGDEAALGTALAAMRQPFTVALLDLSPRTPLGAAEAGALLARQLARIAAEAPRPGVLLVVGGDTLLGLCQATGAEGLRAGAAARGGWGQARWMGGRWDGLPVHARSGAFGGDADLVEAVAALLTR